MDEPVVFEKEWFNPLYFILDDIVDNKPKVKRVLIYGGKSSSKTISVSQIIGVNGYLNNYSSIMFRKETSRVKTTIKKSMSLAIDSCYMNEAWEKQDRTFKGVNGSEIILTGLDDPEKAKGVEGYSFVLFDELNQFDEEEYNQTNLSLRGEGRKVLFATWNPVSEHSWVKTNLVDSYEWVNTEYTLPDPKSFVRISDCGTTVLIKTSYKDNYWTIGSPCGTYGFKDENLIADYNKLKHIDRNQYNINVLGEWGSIKTGEELFHLFNPLHHINNPEVREGYPLWLSFDQNRKPYSTCTIYQIIDPHITKDGFTHINAIDEICLPPPNNETEEICEEFMRRYPFSRFKTVFFTGDYSGNAKHQGISKSSFTDHYQMVDEKLRPYLGNYSKKLFPPPPVEPRRFAINKILSETEHIKLNVSEKAVNLIKDFTELQIGSNGWYDKQKVKVKGVEMAGHCIDTFTYLLHAWKREMFYNK